LSDVRLVDGQISYTDLRSGKPVSLSGINMTLSFPDLASRFAAKGSAVWNKEQVDLDVEIDKPAALDGGGASPIGLKLASKPINVSFKGEATGTSLAKLVGDVDLAVPSLRGLAGWLGTPLAGGNGLGNFAIKGHLDKEGTKIAFEQASLAIDAIKATGSLAFDSAGARPALKGQLDLDQLDVNPYLPPEAKPGAAPAAAPAAGGKPAPAAASGWSEEPIDLSGLKAADADFQLSAGGIRYRKIAIGKSALALHLKDGKLDADLSQLALYQGKGQGKLEVDGSAAVPAIAVSFNLAGIAIEPLLSDAAGMDRLSGSGTLDLSVTGHGHSQRELIGALDGKGSMNLSNGALKGVNILAIVRNAASAATGGALGGTDQTVFSALTGTFIIANGIVRNNDLQLKSEAVPMTGTGTIDLPRREVDYHITPEIAGALAIPVIIKGPFDNLSYQPDLAAIAKNPGKALQGVGNVLKQGGAAGGDLGKVLPGGLKGLLGK
jgi:AsmA protein